MAPEFSDFPQMAPPRGLVEDPPKYHAPSVDEIVDRMISVSDQPGFRDLYNKVANGLHGRALTPYDAFGTVLNEVVNYTDGKDPLIKGLVHGMIEMWLRAIFVDDREFTQATSKAYVATLMSAAALGHLEGFGEHLATHH